MTNRKLSTFLLLVASCFACNFAKAEWHHDNQDIMGTLISVNLWHEDEAIAQQAIDAVMQEMHRIDATLSPYKPDSELSRINQRAPNETVAVSAEMAAILDKALYFSRLSGGAFDISYASVGRHYDYRQQQQPSTEQREQLLPAVNYQLIDFDKSQASVTFRHPQLQIDLGGIAKGYAVDRSIAILRKFGIESATVSAGGDSRILGDKRGKPWFIGIKNPRGKESTDNSIAGQIEEGLGRVAITLPLRDTAVSTSGDYERFFIDRTTGERIHHIINPRTGRSASGIASVTVLGPLGFDTDPMSTTVFVMGVEKGLKLINSLSQFDCIIIDSAGTVHYSDGLAPPAPQ